MSRQLSIIELRVFRYYFVTMVTDDKKNVTVIDTTTKDEVCFYYVQTVPLVTLSQQDNPVTKYVKATSSKSVKMDTWNQNNDSKECKSDSQCHGEK